MGWFSDFFKDPVGSLVKSVNPLATAIEELGGPKVDPTRDFQMKTAKHPVTGAVVSVVGGIINPALGAAITAAYSTQNYFEAARLTEELAAETASMEKRSTSERASRMEEENKRRQSLARARASSSGVGGASTEIYLDALEKSGREEIDWLQEVGLSTYQAKLAEGDLAYNKAMTQFWGGVGNTISSGVAAWDTYQDRKTSV